MKIKNAEIKVIQGDITALKVDAIVNAAPPTLTMDAGLAGLIKKKGGKQIETQAKKRGPLKAGQALLTKAGKLKSKYVIHAVTVDRNIKTDQVYIRQATANALKLANQKKLKSIAFPALGCGVAGFPVVGSAKIMVQEILRLTRETKTALKEIIFCLYKKKVYQEFKKQVFGYIQHVQEKLGPGPYPTVDIIIELKQGLVLIKRANPPYGYALPGGFLDYGESLEEAARRETKEETNLKLKNLRQFYTYSDPRRDPRFQTISTVYIAQGVGSPKHGDDAADLEVVAYRDLLRREYAFDHKQIIEEYLKKKKGKPDRY